MFETTGAAVDNIVVKNAAVGIYSYNAAPTINGFTLTDNDVGVDVYGGMSLPTIYRSTLLSGQSGWKPTQLTCQHSWTRLCPTWIQLCLWWR